MKPQVKTGEWPWGFNSQSAVAWRVAIASGRETKSDPDSLMPARSVWSGTISFGHIDSYPHQIW